MYFNIIVIPIWGGTGHCNSIDDCIFVRVIVFIATFSNITITTTTTPDCIIVLSEELNMKKDKTEEI